MSSGSRSIGSPAGSVFLTVQYPSHMITLAANLSELLSEALTLKGRRLSQLFF
jgi:hypothetical protein